MRKIFFTLTLITIPILSIFASGEKETNLGGQIDLYVEYSPIEPETEDVKIEASESEEETKSGLGFIIVLFVLLAAFIIALPYISKLF